MTLLEPAPGVDLDKTIATFGTLPSVPGVEKDNADLARYADLIAATSPEVIVETGTRRGFSANWFAGRVDRVITIDTRPELIEAPAHWRVERLTGSSVDPAIIAAVYLKVHGRRTMVSLDSDHSRDHVIAEILAYANFVTPGCYLVVEDGVYHYVNTDEYDGDPLEAISATLPNAPHFERDLALEGRYPITGAIAGWWRRRH